MKKNVKGFTLVELLAVIVILALLMILAMPSILELTENAKKSAFQTALKKLVNTAETKYQSDGVIGTQNPVLNASTLMPGSTSYLGCVIISQEGNTIGQVDRVWVYDESYASFKGDVAATKEQVYYKGYCDATAGTGFACETSNLMPVYVRSANDTTDFASIVNTKCAGAK